MAAGDHQKYDDATKAAAIEQYLLHADMSIAQIARDLDVPYPTVHKWIRDNDPAQAVDYDKPTAETLGTLIFDVVVTTLHAIRARTEVTGDPAWIREQKGTVIAALDAAQWDRIVRVVGAFQTQRRSSPRATSRSKTGPWSPPEDAAPSIGLLDFVKGAWRVLEPAIPFVAGWHIELLCSHLEAISRGKLAETNLLVNTPPGTSKSLITAVFWPAWEWTWAPWMRWLTSSYDDALAMRDAVTDAHADAVRLVQAAQDGRLEFHVGPEHQGLLHQQPHGLAHRHGHDRRQHGLARAQRRD